MCHHICRKRWIWTLIAASSVGVLMFSCQTKESGKSKELSADVRILGRIGRATSRYRAALELAENARYATERSLAERHCQITRDILKLEFERAKIDIDELALLKDSREGKEDKQTGGAGRQDDMASAKASKIAADVEKARKEVNIAVVQSAAAKSPRETELAQAALVRGMQALKIAIYERDLFDASLKMEDLRRKERREERDEIKPLRERIGLLEKDALGKDTDEAPLLKPGAQADPPAAGLMGAVRNWWSLYDKVQVLDRAKERVRRLSIDLKESQAESQKQLEQLRDEDRKLNGQIQSQYDRARGLLAQPGLDAQISQLLNDADAKMTMSLIYRKRLENRGKIQDIFRQELLLSSEAEDKLASWIQVVQDNRARAQTRLLNRLGTLLGMMLAVFVAAYFIKKIPKRLVKEEKSAYYFRKLISFAAWLIVILILIFNAAGGIGSISAIVGLAGAGLAIALQDPIVSLVGWFLVVGKYGISVGDRVEINGVKGDVVDVGMLRIAVLEVGNWLSGEQTTGRMVFFPNSFIFKGHFFNYSTTNSFIWDEIHILVTYESQWKKARDIILKVAEEASREVAERARESQEKWARQFHLSMGSPEAYAYVTIADSGVDLVLRYLSEISLRRTMRDRICREILEAFETEKDIQLAYPTQRQLTETRIISAGEGA
jgi:small-conductance mechanosensitive channel